jgi:hypothetical protein
MRKGKQMVGLLVYGDIRGNASVRYQSQEESSGQASEQGAYSDIYG